MLFSSYALAGYGADLFQVDNALSLIKIGGFDGLTNNAAESSSLHDLIYLSTYPGRQSETRM